METHCQTAAAVAHSLEKMALILAIFGRRTIARCVCGILMLDRCWVGFGNVLLLNSGSLWDIAVSTSTTVIILLLVVIICHSRGVMESLVTAGVCLFVLLGGFCTANGGVKDEG